MWDNVGSVDVPSWTKTASHRLRNGKVTSLELLGLPAKQSDNRAGSTDGMTASRGSFRLTLNLHGEGHRGMRSAVVAALDSGIVVCLDRFVDSVSCLLLCLDSLFFFDRKSLSLVATSVSVGGKGIPSQTSVSSIGGDLVPGSCLYLMSQVVS